MLSAGMYARLKPLVRGYVRYAYLRRPRDYRRALDRRVALLRYVGWLGHANLGDEVLFQAFRETLFPHCLLVPHDDFSPLSALAAGRRPVAVVLGGGTLINDRAYLAPLVAATRKGQPVFVFGTGVCDPAYWAEHPGARRIDTDAWLEVLAAARYVGVRGPRSCAWLRERGIAGAEVLGDPALSLPAPAVTDAPAAAPPQLGLNLGTHDPVSGAPGADFEAGLALAREVIARGWTVRWLSMHPIDQRMGEAMQRAVAHPRFTLPAFDPDGGAMLRSIAACRCVVGERLHATVLACALGRPNLSLAYQPKCLDFLESIGRADLAVPTRDIRGDTLIERFDTLLGRGEELSRALTRRCDELRALQRRRALELTAACAKTEGFLPL